MAACRARGELRQVHVELFVQGQAVRPHPRQPHPAPVRAVHRAQQRVGDVHAIAVVRQVYAPDPHRPQVRVVFGRDGRRLDANYDVNLWEVAEAGAGPSSVIAPVDPAQYDLDPLMVM